MRGTKAMAAAVALALVAPGCTFSNRLFEEDALFVRAVPERSDLRTEHPASRDGDGRLVDDAAEDGARGGEVDVGDPAEIPPMARQVAVEVNSSVYAFLDLLDGIMAQPITTRERDRRVWGPYGDGSGSFQLEVRRDAEAPGYFEYALAWSPDRPEAVTEMSSWSEVLYGDFLRGAGGLRDGEGTLCWDADLNAAIDPDFEGGGLVCADHARTDGRIRLAVSFHDWLTPDGDRIRIGYFFDHRPDLGGVLEYVTEANRIDPEGGLRERMATRVRWLAGGPGRADFLLSGGALVDSEIPGSECWDENLLRAWYRVDSAGEDVEQGQEAECVFEAREDVREID